MSDGHSLLLPMRGSYETAVPLDLSSVSAPLASLPGHAYAVRVPQPPTAAAAATTTADTGGANLVVWRSLHLSRAKLKASSRTSALLSGFAMIAMVEVQLSASIPGALLVAFAVCTTLLVSIHMLALMISTCILPHLESAAAAAAVVAVASTSPHRRLHAYIETAWVFSTVVGLMLFLIEIALLCWVQFYSVSRAAAWAATAMLVPVAGVFVVFATHFYRQLVTHSNQLSDSRLRELEQLKGQLELSPAPRRHREDGQDADTHIFTADNAV